jgi:hypothetical protein
MVRPGLPECGKGALSMLDCATEPASCSTSQKKTTAAHQRQSRHPIRSDLGASGGLVTRLDFLLTPTSVPSTAETSSLPNSSPSSSFAPSISPSSPSSSPALPRVLLLPTPYQMRVACCGLREDLCLCLKVGVGLVLSELLVRLKEQTRHSVINLVFALGPLQQSIGDDPLIQ